MAVRILNYHFSIEELDKAVREVLGDKIQEIPRGSRVLNFRVPAQVKLLWELLPEDKRLIIKKAVIASIISLARGKAEVASETGTIVFNVSINEVKAEARAETNIVVNRKAIKELVEWMERIQNLDSPAYPRGLRKAIEKALPEVKKLLQP